MHIVFLTNEYPKSDNSHGGIGTFVQNLARNLTKKDISVSVVGISNTNIDESEIDMGVRIFRLKKSNARFAKFIFNSNRIKKKLKEINSEKKIDIVEGSELSFAFLPNKASYKKIIRMHGGHHFFAVTLGQKTAFWRSFQERRSFLKADALIAVSKFVGNKTKELLKFKLPHTTIYNFIDFNKFQNPKSLLIERNSILFIGTICQKKGVKELIQAFEIVKETLPNAILNLVGRDWNDEIVGSYTTYAKSLIPDIHKNSIFFHGEVPYDMIPSLISNSHICAYPSHMESFGLTLVEAMAMEKPILASNIEPFKEIMTDNVSGLLCNPKSPEDIAQKLIVLLTDSQVAQKYAVNGRKEVLEKFNSEKIVQENINFYTTLI